MSQKGNDVVDLTGDSDDEEGPPALAKPPPPPPPPVDDDEPVGVNICADIEDLVFDDDDDDGDGDDSKNDKPGGGRDDGRASQQPPSLRKKEKEKANKNQSDNAQKVRGEKSKKGKRNHKHKGEGGDCGNHTAKKKKIDGAKNNMIENSSSIAANAKKAKQKAAVLGTPAKGGSLSQEGKRKASFKQRRNGADISKKAVVSGEKRKPWSKDTDGNKKKPKYVPHVSSLMSTTVANESSTTQKQQKGTVRQAKRDKESRSRKGQEGQGKKPTQQQNKRKDSKQRGGNRNDRYSQEGRKATATSKKDTPKHITKKRGPIFTATKNIASVGDEEPIGLDICADIEDLLDEAPTDSSIDYNREKLARGMPLKTEAWDWLGMMNEDPPSNAAAVNISAPVANQRKERTQASSTNFQDTLHLMKKEQKSKKVPQRSTEKHSQQHKPKPSRTSSQQEGGKQERTETSSKERTSNDKSRQNKETIVVEIPSDTDDEDESLYVKPNKGKDRRSEQSSMYSETQGGENDEKEKPRWGLPKMDSTNSVSNDSKLKKKSPSKISRRDKTATSEGAVRAKTEDTSIGTSVDKERTEVDPSSCRNFIVIEDSSDDDSDVEFIASFRGSVAANDDDKQENERKQSHPPSAQAGLGGVPTCGSQFQHVAPNSFAKPSKNTQYPRGFGVAPNSFAKSPKKSKIFKSAHEVPRPSKQNRNENGAFFHKDRDFNFEISQEAALEMQERLFRESVSRVRSRETRHPPPPQFFNQGGYTQQSVLSSPVLDVHKKYPDHWKWKNPFARLGLPNGADQALVKKHWRRLALVYHPDKKRFHDSSARFQAITAAYRKLQS